MSSSASEAWDRLSSGETVDHYPKPPENKYEREIANASKEAIYVDVYDVLMAYEVKNPALAHAIKKMLCTGIRGYKDFNQDIDEAIQALERAKEL